MKFYITVYALILMAQYSYAIPSFPGAQGGGAGTIGGRGGKIIEVTNLNDAGAGSLRAAVQATGPRIVVFRVSGRIDLQSTIHIRSPYITIVGQTAAGGIAIYLGKAPLGGGDGLTEPYAFSIEASDVVIRYIRVWGNVITHPASTPQARGSIAFSIYKPNVVIDHCDGLWLTQEQISADIGGGSNGPANLTVQWNLFAENIFNAVAYPNGQSTAIVVQNAQTSHDPTGVTDADFHHNLIASIDHRLPALCVQRARIINNVVYNFGQMMYVDQLAGTALLQEDWIGNHFKQGPFQSGPVSGAGSVRGRAGYREIMANGGSIASGSTVTFSWYVSGNQSDWTGGDITLGDRGAVSAASSDLTQWSKLTSGSANYQGVAKSGFVPLPNTYKRNPWARLPPPISGADITVDNVTELPSILTSPGGVGASRYLAGDGTWVNSRDNAETRIINEYLTGTGPNASPKSVEIANGGALPVLVPGTPYVDSDHDGMPDIWELKYGFNPNDNSDGPKDKDADGYTNVEEFLNGSNPLERSSGILPVFSRAKYQYKLTPLGINQTTKIFDLMGRQIAMDQIGTVRDGYQLASGHYLIIRDWENQQNTIKFMRIK